MRISDWSSDVCSSDLDSLYYVTDAVMDGNNKPVYLRLREIISASILEGEYRDGDMLPSVRAFAAQQGANRSEEHTSELQSLMRISYAVFCLKKKKLRYSINIYRTDRPPQNR